MPGAIVVRRWAALLLAAGLIAGCRSEPPQVADRATTAPAEAADPAQPPAPAPNAGPMPPIPAALRGCWRSNDPNEFGELPDQPYQLTVTESDLTLNGRRAHPELIHTVSPRLVDGRFVTEEDGHMITVATSLELDDDGRLILHEGDAGSYLFDRCAP